MYQDIKQRYWWYGMKRDVSLRNQLDYFNH
jgi:hypothetical protein